MSKAKLNALEVAVNSGAICILTALETFDTASAVFADECKVAMQHMVDAATKSGLKKDEVAVTAFGNMVRECEAFVDAVAEGLIERKTVTEYAQGCMRAFFHGVEWTASLKNATDMRLPWSKAPAKAGAKASTVIGTNASAAAKAAETVATTSKALPRPQLDALLRTTLKALRDAGLIETAAEVLDVFLEIEGFTEAVKS